MSTITIRNVTEQDFALLRWLAHRCGTLDVHTPYTYWTVCQYFHDTCFLLEADGQPIGYIMAVRTPETVFIWQIGILEPYRGLKLSPLLIGQVAACAEKAGMSIQVSIAQENAASYGAFTSYCAKHQLTMRPAGMVDISDLMEPDFHESEVLYQITR